MSSFDGLSKNQNFPPKNPSEINRLDFLKSKIEQPTQLAKPRFRRNNLLKIFLILVMIFLISGSMYLSELVFSNQKLAGLNKFNPLRQLFSLIISSDKKIAGEDQDRVNFLFLGIGGPGHDGPYLTDTIMLASLKPSTKEVALISIPRDLIAEIANGRWLKINSVYSTGKVLKPDQGAQLISQTIERNFNLPIHYYTIIDFSGFVKLIDDFGGIEVNVERGFTDYSYPTDDYQTQTISFNAGPQTMDGATALIFARSRHGTNGENSDFARSRRQQLILQAVRDKIISFETLISPKRISAIFRLLKDNIETNLDSWEILKLAKLAKEVGNQHIYHLVLDDSPGNFLQSALTEEAGYILKPIEGNFTKIQLAIKSIFDTGKIISEAAKIEVQNGTATPGMAYYTSLALEKSSYHILDYGNAATQDYQRTIIYDLTNGQKPTTLASLQETFNASIITDVPPVILEAYQNNVSITDGQQSVMPDLILILGTDYATSFRLPEFTPAATSTATSTDQVPDNGWEDNLEEKQLE